MRLFAAITPPEEVLEELQGWWAEACLALDAGEWRDMPVNNWHVTLAFYGDVDGDEAEDLADGLAELAGNTEPLWLRLDDFGVFPRMSKARVFWAGVSDAGENPALKSLARCCRQVGRATVRKRSAKENPFKGHITLARSREFPVQFMPEALQDIPPLPPLEWQADALRLYRSRLSSEGARYTILEEFFLRGDEDVRR